ncbi:hypothetical protein [Kocuria nitroreducens]|uniref:hypothetical protein n=1 Tax=Kocuria nitroreducens TaxID=3058914 RepID=UPI0036DBC344
MLVLLHDRRDGFLAAPTVEPTPEQTSTPDSNPAPMAESAPVSVRLPALGTASELLLIPCDGYNPLTGEPDDNYVMFATLVS